MSLNIRKVGEVADGSVTADKLADNAVDLGTAKVTGELPETKLANSAVTEGKLADLAISTGKLKNNVVTLAKADDDIRLNTFIGDETEVSVTGIVEEVIKEFRFPVKSDKFSPKKVRFIGSLKSSSGHTATLKLYLNAEETARSSVSSAETEYELVDSEFDISDLGNGHHTCKVILVSSDAAGIVYNDLVDVLLIR